jgi:phosphoribosylanthranilate isomerase
MKACGSPRIKICCIQSLDEAWLAVRHGASALGLVSRMPSGPGVIDEALIAELARATPPGVTSVLLTCEQEPRAIVEQQRRCRASALQLCDTLESEGYPLLREELPGVRIIQVIHVTGREALDEAVAVAPLVDALLLDSGNPRLAVKELGGTGRTHDWTISREIRERVDCPIWLAGGLRPENVAEAIAEVGPFGVDICSGVRINGRLDAGKLERFVRSCRASA